jgi:hypothetical protein
VRGIRAWRSGVLLALALGCLGVGATGASAQHKATTAPTTSAGTSQTQAMAVLVRRFYTDSIIANRGAIYTARFDKAMDTTPNPGALIPHGTRVVTRQIVRDSARAVFETETGPENHFADWYTFLVRDAGTWKIDNVRLFELPPIHYIILDTLDVRKNLPDSLVFVRDRMRLSASNNAALKANFAAHRMEIEKFAARFESHSEMSALDESGQTFPANALQGPEADSLRASMHALKLGAALRRKDALQCVRYKIGGSEQTTVGYMHFGATCPAPTMGEDDVVYFERVAPGWYLYRTG